MKKATCSEDASCTDGKKNVIESTTAVSEVSWSDLVGGDVSFWMISLEVKVHVKASCHVVVALNYLQYSPQITFFVPPACLLQIAFPGWPCFTHLTQIEAAVWGSWCEQQGEWDCRAFWCAMLAVCNGHFVVFSAGNFYFVESHCVMATYLENFSHTSSRVYPRLQLCSEAPDEEDNKMKETKAPQVVHSISSMCFVRVHSLNDQFPIFQHATSWYSPSTNLFTVSVFRFIRVYTVLCPTCKWFSLIGSHWWFLLCSHQRSEEWMVLFGRFCEFGTQQICPHFWGASAESGSVPRRDWKVENAGPYCCSALVIGLKGCSGFSTFNDSTIAIFQRNVIL